MAGEHLPPTRSQLQPSLRAAVYLGVWLVAFLAAGIGATVVALATGLSTLRGLAALDLSQEWRYFLLSNLAGLGVTLLVTWLVLRWLDRRPLASIGLAWGERGPVALAFGAALGVALMTAIFLVELAADWLRVHDLLSADPAAFWPAFVGMLVGFAAGAATEEIVHRGYILPHLTEQWGRGVAVAVSSALFAVLHGLNPGAGPAALALLFGAGVLFAAAYYAGRSLWLPIGLHFSWNTAEGLVYGFPVSGLLTPRLIVAEQTGPEVVTGGRFGPEGGLIIFLAFGLGLAALWGWRLQCSKTTR
ncbi:MAG: CPBP family intramembrane metalloprotease [Chloroflexi bacterium]|nr:CPBP family intramembrane metalloprotease [Chloroflexota bacterium]